LAVIQSSSLKAFKIHRVDSPGLIGVVPACGKKHVREKEKLEVFFHSLGFPDNLRFLNKSIIFLYS